MRSATLHRCNAQDLQRRPWPFAACSMHRTTVLKHVLQGHVAQTSKKVLSSPRRKLPSRWLSTCRGKEGNGRAGDMDRTMHHKGEESRAPCCPWHIPASHTLLDCTAAAACPLSSVDQAPTLCRPDAHWRGTRQPPAGCGCLPRPSPVHSVAPNFVVLRIMWHHLANMQT